MSRCFCKYACDDAQGTTPAAVENFLYFLMFGMDVNSPHIDYVIVLVDVVDEQGTHIGPPLPAEVNNVGLDFCSFAETFALFGGLDAVRALYRYFLFVNDTVRGPFLPPHVGFAGLSRNAARWYQLFASPMISDMTGMVKMVGSYLSSGQTQSVVAAVVGLAAHELSL